jgi:hypothetical protein
MREHCKLKEEALDCGELAFEEAMDLLQAGLTHTYKT